ncbi:Brat protein [Aphelenchoides fujianensis]|nr:Brat protein [Aphelenchoides fujianensis]
MDSGFDAIFDNVTDESMADHTWDSSGLWDWGVDTESPITPKTPKTPKTTISTISEDFSTPPPPPPSTPHTTYVDRTKISYARCFGQFGVMPGQFTEPSGIAATLQNQIAITDTNNHRVQVYDKEGHFLFQFGERGNGHGQMLYPHRIAISPANGDFVITERSPVNQIQIFTATGEFVRKFGANILLHPRSICVDHKNFIIVVECKVKRIVIFDNYGNVFAYNGEFRRQIGAPGITNFPVGVTIDLAGNLVVCDNHNCFHITIFDSDGNFKAAYESTAKHLQCFDTAVLMDGHVAIASKDYRIYVYRYGQEVAPAAIDFAHHQSARRAKKMMVGLPVAYNKISYIRCFGQFGVMPGQFTEPAGVASTIDGNIAITDTNNHRVQVYDKEGHFLFQFGERGKLDGQMLYPHRIAVSPANGDFVITERSPVNQIQVFTAAGEFNFIIVVECKVKRIVIFDNLGNVYSMFNCFGQLQFPNCVAANDRDELFISDNRAHCVKVFGYGGELHRQIGGAGVTSFPDYRIYIYRYDEERYAECQGQAFVPPEALC